VCVCVMVQSQKPTRQNALAQYSKLTGPNVSYPFAVLQGSPCFLCTACTDRAVMSRPTKYPFTQSKASSGNVCVCVCSGYTVVIISGHTHTHMHIICYIQTSHYAHTHPYLRSHVMFSCRSQFPALPRGGPPPALAG
jgi:hypothetical protein